MWKRIVEAAGWLAAGAGLLYGVIAAPDSAPVWVSQSPLTHWLVKWWWLVLRARPVALILSIVLLAIGVLTLVGFGRVFRRLRAYLKSILGRVAQDATPLSTPGVADSPSHEFASADDGVRRELIHLVKQARELERQEREVDDVVFKGLWANRYCWWSDRFYNLLCANWPTRAEEYDKITQVCGPLLVTLTDVSDARADLRKVVALAYRLFEQEFPGELEQFLGNETEVKGPLEAILIQGEDLQKKIGEEGNSKELHDACQRWFDETLDLLPVTKKAALRRLGFLREVEMFPGSDKWRGYRRHFLDLDPALIFVGDTIEELRRHA